MSVNIYTSKDIQKVMSSGLISYETHMMLRTHIKPGITTKRLDELAEKFIRSKGGRPAFLGLYGCPSSILTSVNDGVVHGLPKESVVLKEGDIISIDLGVVYDGFYSDTAWTWPVGQISEEAKRLVTITQQCLYKGIFAAVPGNRVGAIGNAVQTHAEGNGYSVVRTLAGHGVGKAMHEDPQVPNFGKKKDGVKLRSGMVLAIEPMINEGRHETVTDKDQWTIKTKDGKLSAHFEHTIAITAKGPMIATLPKGVNVNVFELMAS